ncbi:helix-turn-helix domain-containing protein [Ekhidna sp.]|uniref:helix-turn-helix transcriptional regulator n=1 Tax=Ekhidna sp. TaxID=2608089 RepID=UPI00329A30CD
MDVTIYTLEELRAVMRDELQAFTKDDEQLLTREQAAQFLSISLPTLHNWTKKGKIKCQHIPGTGRIYYLKSDLLNSVIECTN